MIATIIPCYREPLDRVRRTVDSALAVTLIDRVILVDDGCNDTALDSLASDRLEVLHLPRNVGVAAGMNRAIETLDPGDIICRLDVGDVFYPAAKAAQLADVVNNARPASFTSHYDPVTNETFRPPPNWSTRIYTDGAFCICTAVFDRSAWSAIGGFDESLRYGDDWDFTLRMQHAIGWHFYDAVTCEAGAFPGGHTQTATVDPVKRARRHDDTERIREKVRALQGRTAKPRRRS